MSCRFRGPKGIRNLPVVDLPASGKDAVSISESGRTAAEVARYIRESAGESEIRQERVDAVKQQLEEGRQNVEEVLTKLASELLNYL